MVKNPMVWELNYAILNTCQLFSLLFFWKYSKFKRIKNFLSSIQKYNCIFKSWCLFSFLTDSFCFVDSLKVSISSFNLFVFQVHHPVINNCYKFFFRKIFENHMFYHFSHYLFYKLNNLYLLFFLFLQFCSIHM